jgi:hypothetical protein
MAFRKLNSSSLIESRGNAFLTKYFENNFCVIVLFRGDELDCSDSKAARTMYTRMKSIYRAVCDMVRKREENPCLVVDTLAKITWGGTISVELADKETVRWNCRNGVGPPFRDHSHLSQGLF